MVAFFKYPVKITAILPATAKGGFLTKTAFGTVDRKVKLYIGGIVRMLSTLSGYYTGQYVSDFNRFSKLYHVTMQAPAEYRVNAESLHHGDEEGDTE